MFKKFSNTFITESAELDLSKAASANAKVDKGVINPLLKAFKIEPSTDINQFTKNIYTVQGKLGIEQDGICGELTIMALKDRDLIERTLVKVGVSHDITGDWTTLIKGFQTKLGETPTGILSNSVWSWVKSGGLMISDKPFKLSDEISKYYKWSDFVKPADVLEVNEGEYWENIKALAQNIDQIKEKYPEIIITSGFRSKNSSIEQTKNGQIGDHPRGCAADIQIPGNLDKMDEMMNWIIQNVPFSQVIREKMGKLGGWVHYANGGKAVKPTNKVLLAQLTDGSVKYSQWA